MSKRSLVLMASLCALLGFSWAHAQDQPARGKHRGGGGADAAAPGGPGGPGGGRGFDGTRMRLQRIKDQMAPTDDEWKELSPKIEKVLKLEAEVRPMPMGGRRGGPREGAPAETPPGAQAAPANPVTQARTDLNKAVEDKSASADDIAKKLADYREARDKAHDELVVAQKDLKKSVKPRQEAVLVLNNVLD